MNRAPARPPALSPIGGIQPPLPFTLLERGALSQSARGVVGCSRPAMPTDFLAFAARPRAARVRAIWPRRRGSVDCEKIPGRRKWARAEGDRILAAAARWNRTSGESVEIDRTDPRTGLLRTYRRPPRYGGHIGSAAMRVLTYLLDGDRNGCGYLYTTGMLFPAVAKIAADIGLGISTVYEALARLRSLGIISWVNRCARHIDDDGAMIMIQCSNLYTIHAPTEWIGWTDRDPSPVAVDIGAPAPIPDLVDQIAAASSAREKAQLYGMSDDGFSRIAARLWSEIADRHGRAGALFIEQPAGAGGAAGVDFPVIPPNAQTAITLAKTVDWVQPGAQSGRLVCGWTGISETESRRRLEIMRPHAAYCRPFLIQRFLSLDPIGYQRWISTEGGTDPPS